MSLEPPMPNAVARLINPYWGFTPQPYVFEIEFTRIGEPSRFGYKAAECTEEFMRTDPEMIKFMREVVEPDLKAAGLLK